MRVNAASSATAPAAQVDAEAFKASVVSDEAKYVLQTYARPADIVITRGEGTYVFDASGKKYLDFAAGIAVNALGHSHPAWVAAVQDQASKLMHTSNLFHTVPQVRGPWSPSDCCADAHRPGQALRAGRCWWVQVEAAPGMALGCFRVRISNSSCRNRLFYRVCTFDLLARGVMTSAQGRYWLRPRHLLPEAAAVPTQAVCADLQVQLAKKLVESSFADKVFFCNSGTEANEGAIKFARKFARISAGADAQDPSANVPTEIVAFTNSFHGRTMGALALTAKKQYQIPFGPVMPGAVQVGLAPDSFMPCGLRCARDLCSL
jgi:4-aminobutyrate aminotransferase-like enzyme